MCPEGGGRIDAVVSERRNLRVFDGERRDRDGGGEENRGVRI